MLRTGGRYAALIAALALVLPVLPWQGASLWVPAVSPWVAAVSAVAVRGVSLVTLVALPVLALAVWRRRWFCRHACPTGLVLEWIGKLSPIKRRTWRRVPAVGQWIALLTIGGAVFGYPLLLWLDPLAMFAGSFGLLGTMPGWPEALAGGLLLAVGLLSLVAPGLWCRRLCPLGASQDLIAAGRLRLATPSRATADSGAAENAGRGKPWQVAVGRRALLATGAGVAAGWWLTRGGTAGASAKGATLRPPGAAPPEQFGGLCIRCGNCIRACPTDILHAELGEGGVATLLAPVLRIENGYCLKECHDCTQVCPSGAIRRLALDEKQAEPIGLAKVDMEICLLGWDKECAVCKNRCPYEAIEIVFDEEEYITTPKVDPAKCPGCGACEVACPTTPEKAIFVVALEKPTHSAPPGGKADTPAPGSLSREVE